MKRLFSLCLLLAMLVSTVGVFAACPSPDGPSGPGAGVDVDFIDHLDETGDSMDFSAQEEFVISYRDTYKYEVYGDEKSTDKLDTLIYNRNRLMEQRFGIEIAIDSVVQSKGPTDDDVHYNYVQGQLNSGDVSFDAIAIYAYQGGKLILGNGGNFLDWRSEVPYCKDSIKAGEEWWPTDINIDSTVMGRQFVAVSDFCITAMEMTYTVIFNKSLAKTTNVAQGVDSTKYDTTSTLYDVVRGNDWTLDTMTSIVKGYWKDSATNGKRGERDIEDRFGLIGEAITDGDAWAYSLGFNYIQNDGISAPEVWTWDGTQYDAILKLRDLYYSNGAWMQTIGAAGDLNERAGFFAQEDRVLFQLNTLESLKYDVIHNMEQDFGVLPYPKYTKDQAKFLTGSLDHYSVLAIPYTTAFDEERLRMTGALIEALSAENCNSVKNPYYDEIVTHHNVTDGDSVEMINIIMAGRVYDLGMYHYNELVFDSTDKYNGAFALFFRYLIKNKDQDIVQYWQQYGGTLDGQMDDLLANYADVLG